MNTQSPDSLEKIRQQFDTGPYPRVPLQTSPKNDLNLLYFHNLVTAYYRRNQKVADTQGKWILDAGCGSGHKALALAEANPGSKIIGIDISEVSVDLARQRLAYHGFENAEFYAISIDDIADLGFQFDYINCDEVLYLIPDIHRGLQSFKSVLKPEGIIRTNLHSSAQRYTFYLAQELFTIMGLMDDNPGEMEIEICREMLDSVHENVFLKAKTWDDRHKAKPDWFLCNYLLQGDKGYSIPEMFAALGAADLEFVSMVNWRCWELRDLFQDPDNLPPLFGISLGEISIEQQLRLFELLERRHRLLDFWCGHHQGDRPRVAVADWTKADWQRATVQLHPQLQNSQVKADLIDCIASRSAWEISKYIKDVTPHPVYIDSKVGACLLPLWDGPQPVMAIVKRWEEIAPVDPVSLEEMDEARAEQVVRELLVKLESYLYLLLELSA